jgi:hypothetical protein
MERMGTFFIFTGRATAPAVESWYASNVLFYLTDLSTTTTYIKSSVSVWAPNQR